MRDNAIVRGAKLFGYMLCLLVTAEATTGAAAFSSQKKRPLMLTWVRKTSETTWTKKTLKKNSAANF